jgi:hypothetical protein
MILQISVDAGERSKVACSAASPLLAKEAHFTLLMRQNGPFSFSPLTNGASVAPALSRPRWSTPADLISNSPSELTLNKMSKARAYNQKV